MSVTPNIWMENVVSGVCVAPRQRFYYCEHCKESVLPIDADERFDLVISFTTVSVTEIIIAKHKKCGHILEEKFWKEQ